MAFPFFFSPYFQPLLRDKVNAYEKGTIMIIIAFILGVIVGGFGLYIFGAWVIKKTRNMYNNDDEFKDDVINELNNNADYWWGDMKK